jgi:dTDP-4-amino-4,6-dideoxygalactose transaminase
LKSDPPPDIPFALPFIGPEEEEAVLRVLRSGWLPTGKEAAAFEAEFAAFCEPAFPHSAPGLHPLAVNSATSGLHLAMEASGVGPGDTVLLPSLTFTSTAEVVRYLGADVAFVDVEEGAPFIDPVSLERTIERLSSEGRRLRAVAPVHYGGWLCNMEAIAAIAAKHHLKVVEDAAPAFPLPGPFLGDAAVFSFYATKTISTGEGGMILYKDAEAAKRSAVMRSHGIDRTIFNRYTDTKASWYYQVVAPGYKYNMSDILAALGRVQLGRAVELRDKRAAIAARYSEAFGDNPALQTPADFPHYPANAVPAWHLYPLRLNLEALNIGRDAFIEELQARGIGVSVHFIPLHTMPYYKNRYRLHDDDLPHSMSYFRREISLPLWPGMSAEQTTRVIEAVLDTAGVHRK